MDSDEIAFLEQNGIIINDVIAQGGFGVIYYVYSTKYKTNFALKKIPQTRFVQEEFECLQKIDESNVVSLYQFLKFKDSIYVLMEYCPFDLERLFKIRPKLNDHDLYDYIKQIVLAVKTCHDRRIAHCDIKPSNFMVDKYGRVKLGDFGLATFLDGTNCKVYKGTKLFMAPEIFCKKTYNPIMADIWALGVSIYFMATHTYPFFGNDNIELCKMIVSGIYSDGFIEDNLLRHLISRCLEVNPEKRATIDELLSMPYFKQFSIEENEKVNLTRRQSYQPNHDSIIRPKLTLKKRSSQGSSPSVCQHLLSSKLIGIRSLGRSSKLIYNL